MAQPQRVSIVLAAAMATALASRAHAGATTMGQAAVDRMIDLNRKAYADIQSQRFQAAKYWLAEALVISETAGLENDEMTARTYVHLAVVHLTGLKDREEAIRQFCLALKINPNITISAGLETPALKAAYLQARERMELPPNPDTSLELASTPNAGATSPAPEASGRPWPDSAYVMRSELDPDLPARVPSALFCPLPFEIPGEQDLLVHCLTQKQQKRASATLYYRADGTSTTYAALPMAHSPKGWLIAVIPASEIKGRSLSYYVKAQLPGATTALSCGYPDSPNALLIRSPAAQEEAAPGAGSDRAPAGGGSRAGYRRAPGALWLALGAGTGTVYHAREPVDSNTKVLGTTNPLYVESGFSAATTFQLEPELGYQFGPRFSLSLLMRYQYASKDGNAFTPATGEHAVLTSAFAGFLQGQLLGSTGNFQPYLSLGTGLGTSFLAVVSKRCSPSLCALDHSDTLHGGVVGFTGGIGLIYRFTPGFGVLIGLKEIVTLPKVMALTELNLGFEVAYDFRAGTAPKRAEAQDQVAWR